MQYELHDTLLIIKSNNGFETAIDAEYLSKVEIENMLNFLVQNDVEDDEDDDYSDESSTQICNLTLPTYNLIPFDHDRDITSFIQVRKDSNEIIILLQVDHSHYSTSFLQKFPLNQENICIMVEMLNKLLNVAFSGTIIDINEHFVIDNGNDSNIILN